MSKKTMMAVAAVAAVVLVVLAGWFILSDSDDAETNSGPERYSNEAYGISFDYPQDWQLNERDTGLRVIPGASKSSSLDGQLALTGFVKLGQPVETTRDDAQTLFDGLSDQISTTVEEGTFFGLAGYQYTHNYVDQDEPTFYSYVLERGDDSIEFRITASQLSFEEDEELINQVIEILESAELS